MNSGAILRAATLAIPLLLVPAAHASMDAPGEPEALPSVQSARGPEDRATGKALDYRTIAAPQEVLRQVLKSPEPGLGIGGAPQSPARTFSRAQGPAANPLGLQPRSTSGDVKFRIWGNGTSARAAARIPF